MVLALCRLYVPCLSALAASLCSSYCRNASHSLWQVGVLLGQLCPHGGLFVFIVIPPCVHRHGTHKQSAGEANHRCEDQHRVNHRCHRPPDIRTTENTPHLIIMRDIPGRQDNCKSTFRTFFPFSRKFYGITIRKIITGKLI